MSNAILGKKVGMSQIFDETGNRVSVTVIQAGPCIVLQKRVTAKHRYSALQLGFEETVARRLNKPDRAFFERLNLKPMRHVREIRLAADQVENYKVGDSINVSIFAVGDFVDVVGTSKGKGFQGVVKKYHFKGSTQTRGTHEYRRHPGSIGHREFPGKVWKGKKLPGHMGSERVTIQNMKLAKVDPENNLLLIRGAVPGHRGALVLVRKAVKKSR
jgi:large subunit ribosomal protein L3